MQLTCIPYTYLRRVDLSEIRAAITDCRRRALEQGEGVRAVVVFPAANVCTTEACPMQEDVVGESFFMSGALNLTSNMTFRIEPGLD